MRDSEPRVFSIEEANALVPQLSEMVGGQMQLAQQIARLAYDLSIFEGYTGDTRLARAEALASAEVAAALPSSAGLAAEAALAAGSEQRLELVDITPRASDAIEVRAMKRKLRLQVRRYRDGWQQVRQLGVVIKDTHAGWLDFYGRVEERLVCLSWHYGEATIDHYHELVDEVAARKPLAPVRRYTLN